VQFGLIGARHRKDCGKLCGPDHYRLIFLWIVGLQARTARHRSGPHRRETENATWQDGRGEDNPPPRRMFAIPLIDQCNRLSPF
jgi:hypothetical protein